MLRTIILFLALTATAFGQNSAKDEAQVWQLEKAYWEYVKGNDLEKYRALWQENFVGWPFVSPAPVRKDHITDWMTANTSKGITPPLVLDRAARYSGNRRYCGRLLSNGCNMGQWRRCRSQDRQIADHAHVDPNARRVADHRRHVLACECRG